MKKEKTVKTHTRKTKSGKIIQVKQHKQSYMAAKDDPSKKDGAGKEFEKKATELPDKDVISMEEFEAWYHNPKSKEGKEAAARLKEHLGAAGYKALNKHANDTYSEKGAAAAYRQLSAAGKNASPSAPSSSAIKEGAHGNVSEKEFTTWYNKPDSKAGQKVAEKMRAALGDKLYNKFDRHIDKNWEEGKQDMGYAHFGKWLKDGEKPKGMTGQNAKMSTSSMNENKPSTTDMNTPKNNKPTNFNNLPRSPYKNTGSEIDKLHAKVAEQLRNEGRGSGIVDRALAKKYMSAFDKVKDPVTKAHHRSFYLALKSQAEKS